MSDEEYIKLLEDIIGVMRTQIGFISEKVDDTDRYLYDVAFPKMMQVKRTREMINKKASEN